MAPPWTPAAVVELPLKVEPLMLRTWPLARAPPPLRARLFVNVEFVIVIAPLRLFTAPPLPAKVLPARLFVKVDPLMMTGIVTSFVSL
jgi:hypothetical protein